MKIKLKKKKGFQKEDCWVLLAAGGCIIIAGVAEVLREIKEEKEYQRILEEATEINCTIFKIGEDIGIFGAADRKRFELTIDDIASIAVDPRFNESETDLIVLYYIKRLCGMCLKSSDDEKAIFTAWFEMTYGEGGD